MARKPDLSRLVSLDLSPSEAVQLAALLTEVMRFLGPRTTPAERELLAGVRGHIETQLNLLQWPAQTRAPFPV